ncbi:GNAT family N-acetyltransferase [Halobacillus litoralis]|uniref:GNAT family N-acetyltransferase n=1 Tax=Halobacillus litoralis TaxID=45668 RepID=UPI001CD1F163|nr:GNAT family N-acetyltransferase [Halobacillus litoralis]MCA0969732.1 GNAT family N-acetyltransferase [Halobacillus litoralis]
MRVLQPEDAHMYVTLLDQLERESEFLLFEPGERNMTEEQARSMIQAFSQQENSAVWGEERNGELVGHVTCIGGRAHRERHAIKLIAGVQEAYQGQGIAGGLFERAIEWARDSSIVRMELTVMVHNERAIQLYKKYGFEVEGVKRKSLKVSGDWVDEYVMSLILS